MDGRPGAGRAAAWCALFLAGQIATLLLIEAGPLVRYQHYPPLRRLLLDSPPAAIAVFAVQVLAVALGLVRARATVGSMLSRATGWPILVVGWCSS